MGTAHGLYYLRGHMDVYRKGARGRHYAGYAQICACGRYHGSLITYTVIRSMGSLGPAKAALLIVVSQIIIAYAIELFGLFGVEKAPFAWNKIIGAVIAIGGIVIFER